MKGRFGLLAAAGVLCLLVACPADDDTSSGGGDVGTSLDAGGVDSGGDGDQPDDTGLPEPADPLQYYGPCDNIENPYCSGAATSSDGYCLCTIPCRDVSECPVPLTGDAEPVCQEDDLVVNGINGECLLPCPQDDDCPQSTTCRNGQCRFVDTRVR